MVQRDYKEENTAHNLWFAMERDHSSLLKMYSSKDIVFHALSTVGLIQLPAVPFFPPLFIFYCYTLKFPVIMSMELLNYFQKQTCFDKVNRAEQSDTVAWSAVFFSLKIVLFTQNTLQSRPT